MASLEIDSFRGLPGPSGGPPGRVHHAVQHHPHQRHRLLPRPRGLGVPADRGPARACGRQGRRTSRSGSGARAAPPARRRTPSPWCWPRSSGPDEFRERVKIYATDVDEDALDAARHGALHRRGSRGRARRAARRRYFEHIDGRYVFRKDLRRQVIFGRNDLRAGRPDLPDRPAGLPQHAHVLQRGDPGPDPEPLPLRAERGRRSCSSAGPRRCWPTGRPFVPVDLKRRIFAEGRPSSGPTGAARRPASAPTAGGDRRPDVGCAEAAARGEPGRRSSWSIAAGPVALDQRAGPRRSSGFRPATSAGRCAICELSYRPVELRSLHRAGAAPSAARSRSRTWSGARRAGRVPLAGCADRPAGRRADGRRSASLIASTTSPATAGCSRELEQSHQELETAYEELQSTNEELETTNEELQSTVEELETTNEELQSTNEELETMNEELQSTNEELQTINDELRQRGEELNAANALPAVGPDQPAGRRGGGGPRARLLAWSRHAEELWGLRLEEVVRAAPPQPRHRSAGRAAAPARSRPACRATRPSSRWCSTR